METELRFPHPELSAPESKLHRVKRAKSERHRRNKRQIEPFGTFRLAPYPLYTPLASYKLRHKDFNSSQFVFSVDQANLNLYQTIPSVARGGR